MCLVIDANCFAKVFDKDNNEHHRFKPVLDWITKGQGSVIYGGTKYRKELKAAKRYLAILVELNRQGRIVELPDNEVDDIAQEIWDIVGKTDFNDEHLVGIICVARCNVVCTDDKKAESYLKRKDLYPKGVRKPKIYKYSEHKKLCCKDNIVGKCLERLS